MQFLRDPAWQFVGAIVAFLALVLSLVIASIQRRRKRLAYQILTDTPFFTVQEEVKGRVQMLLDGAPVEDPSLIVLRVMNRGNMPIRVANFQRPLSFTFGDKAEVIAAEVIRQRPANLTAAVTFENGKVTLTPLLLNGGDSLDIKCLVSRVEFIDDDARVEGVSAVHRAFKQPIFPAIAAILGLVLSIGAVFVGLPRPETRYHSEYSTANPFRLIVDGLSVIGIVLLAIAALPTVIGLLREMRENWGKFERER